MYRRIILITGANRGLGYETAHQLGLEGHIILLSGRNYEKVKDAAEQLSKEGIIVDPVELDVTDLDSIRRAVDYIASRYAKLDTLINNAGIGVDMFTGLEPSQVPLEVWRTTYETNLFGVVAVTTAFLPLLHKSEAGCIVNLSSSLGSISLHADPSSLVYDITPVAYDTSKAALNQYTVHLAHELRHTSIKVNSAHPGWVKTDFGGPAAPMDVIEGVKTSVWLATLPSDGPTGMFFHLHDRVPW